MFTLIITIIAIALVAALAIASLYYGGSAFTQGTAKAQASALVAQAQQIAGANDLYANDNSGTFATTTSALVTGKYLSVAPTVPASVSSSAWAVDGTNDVTLTVTNAQVCAEVDNEAQGGTSVTSSTIPTTKPTSQFGCYNAATSGSSYTVFYQGS